MSQTNCIVNTSMRRFTAIATILFAVAAPAAGDDTEPITVHKPDKRIILKIFDGDDKATRDLKVKINNDTARPADIERYQKLMDLDVDGILGPKTMKALKRND